MQFTGLIRPDGSVVLDGTVPVKATLVGISPDLIAIHFPGGAYWTNGGRQYASAWIEVRMLESLTVGEACWRFTAKHPSSVLSFHPTRKHAAADALQELERMTHRAAEKARTGPGTELLQPRSPDTEAT